MDRTGTVALCALALAWAAPVPASAQSATPAAGSPAGAGQSVKAHKTTKPRRRKADAVAAPASAAAGSYDLVPSSKATSPLARARQNAFGTPDADPAPSGDPRQIGIGLGGSDGMTPGVNMGF